jgi:glycerol-3-phosphate dehydrogenase (NAD(P)+)
MRIAVLGAGSWGTTVASLLAGRHNCTIWSRDPELAREIAAGAEGHRGPGESHP